MASKRAKRLQQKWAHHFAYGGPAVRGDAYAVFDDGRCFRVQNGKKWFIYNDTINSEMHINFSFGPSMVVRKPKHARTVITRDAQKWWCCTVVVYPLETVPFVKLSDKKVNGLRSSNVSRPLTAGYIERMNQVASAKCAKEMRAVAGMAGQTHTDEELLYKCRKNKVKYVDSSFQPVQLSIKRPDDKKNVASMSAITWKRPEDYIPECAWRNIKLFRNRVHPSDIQQGHLGDCWLMCSIAVVAESKTMIKDMFRHPVSNSKKKKEEKAGGYRVYLNKNGWWRNVIVDDYLPTLNCGLCFAQSADGPFELWVSLLEKAYAKAHGSYARIVGGDALDALQDLTGFPTFSFRDIWQAAANDEDKASEFFKMLLRFRKKGYLISIGTPGQDKSDYNQVNNPAAQPVAFESRYSAAGLGTGHAYSVLKVRQFYLPRVKLLKIRNPWGTGVEWTGAWGRDSDKWKKHPLVRRSCKPSPTKDGTFWMEWKDVVQYFDGGGACMVKKSWVDYRFRGQFIDIHPTFCLKVEAKRAQRLFVVLSQQDRRELHPSDPNQLYKGLLIAVSKFNPETNQQETVAISTSNPEEHPADSFTFVVKRDIGLEFNLDPKGSPYYIVPRIMAANRGGPKDFSLGLLTPNKSTENGLRISFVRLPEACLIYKNIKTFKTEGESPVHMQFQYKKRGGVPRLKEGVTVFGADYVKEQFPFPY